MILDAPSQNARLFGGRLRMLMWRITKLTTSNNNIVTGCYILYSYVHVVVGNLGNYGRIGRLICLYLCAVSGGNAVSRGRYLLGRTNNVGDPRSRTCEQATAGTTSLSTYTSIRTCSFTDSQTSATASYSRQLSVQKSRELSTSSWCLC